MKESPWSVIDIAPAAEMVDVQGDAVGVTTAFQPRAWRICSAGFPNSACL
jgi:hypothetical protein